MSTESGFTVYCRAPPLPTELWTRWNLDPLLLATASLIAVTYTWGWWQALHGRQRAPASRYAAFFFCGWLIALLALISPLCALSVALFSARAVQHLVLVAVAAPLIILGRPEVALAANLPGSVNRPVRVSGMLRFIVRVPVAWAVFAAFQWLWHAPGPYDATFQSPLLYWTMHASIFGSALLLWRALLTGGSAGAVGRIACGFTTAVHMGLLGALLTLSPRPLYEAHSTTTTEWGLDALTDQQLGGLIMWVPGGSLLLISALLAMSSLLRTAGEVSSRGTAADLGSR